MNLYQAIQRRTELIRATRRAFKMWEASTLLHTERVTALRPSRACIAEAKQLVLHRVRRYLALETALAFESGLTTSEVYNELAQWNGIHPRLMENITQTIQQGIQDAGNSEQGIQDAGNSEWDTPTFSLFGDNFQNAPHTLPERSRETLARQQRELRFAQAA